MPQKLRVFFEIFSDRPPGESDRKWGADIRRGTAKKAVSMERCRRCERAGLAGMALARIIHEIFSTG
jgi:hypothetical protein